ncbi:hypothetical protein RF11_01972 [Thelohanellus kitauei]|uniref:Uncharacterized protein n=1 Tax=Thelohanellus kitauei TaxID=669202 RepID=A0A0C2ML76_THEKT|nr:hypothetical protein RF11_01972 [Thelohanellus kitauei]
MCIPDINLNPSQLASDRYTELFVNYISISSILGITVGPLVKLLKVKLSHGGGNSMLDEINESVNKKSVTEELEVPQIVVQGSKSLVDEDSKDLKEKTKEKSREKIDEIGIDDDSSKKTAARFRTSQASLQDLSNIPSVAEIHTSSEKPAIPEENLKPEFKKSGSNISSDQ